MKKWNSLVLLVPILLTSMCAMTVLAGDINGNEANVIGAASGTFEYNGKKYVAGSQYLGQLQGKLAEDGVDLSADQANELLGMMYDSVGSGVTQGYLVEIDGGDSNNGSTPSTNPQDGNDSSDNKPGNKPGNKPSDKPGITPDNDIGSKETDKPIDGDSETNGSIINGNGDHTDGSGSSINEETRIDRESEHDTNGIKRNQKEGQLLDDNNNYAKESQAQQYIDSLVDKASGKKEVTKESDNAATKKENKKTSLSAFIDNNKTFLAAGLLIVLMVIGIIIAARKMKRSIKGARLEVKDYIDIHTHILPGVDDGSPDMETTLKMVDVAYKEGIRKMIATPHYHIGHRHKSAEDLRKIFEETEKTVGDRYPDFNLYLGNELFCTDGILEKVESGRALTIAGSRYVLIEFRPDESYSKIYERVAGFLRARYVPIIAHVERYRNVCGDRAHLEELRQAGALLQMNFSGVKRHQRLIGDGLIDFIATDCHDIERRSPEIKEAMKYLSSICTEAQIKKILVDNPDTVLKNKYI